MTAARLTYPVRADTLVATAVLDLYSRTRARWLNDNQLGRAGLPLARIGRLQHGLPTRYVLVPLGYTLVGSVLMGRAYVPCVYVSYLVLRADGGYEFPRTYIPVSAVATTRWPPF